MKLKAIYDQLRYGELRHISMGTGAIGDAPSEMGAEQYKAMFPMLQMGLTELHKEFPLRERDFEVVLVPGQNVYSITMDYAKANTKSKVAEADRYLDDTADPFQNDFMRVERIFGVLSGEEFEIPLNKRGNATAIRTPEFNKLVLPTDSDKAPWLKETTRLKIISRSDHPELPSHLSGSPSILDVHLPSTHLQALLYYMASRATNPNGITGEFHEGNNYYSKYEREVQKLHDKNYDADVDIENEKLEMRGFV